jgi:hypothetical protein
VSGRYEGVLMSLTGQSESHPIDRGQFNREPPPRARVIKDDLTECGQ